MRVPQGMRALGAVVCAAGKALGVLTCLAAAAWCATYYVDATGGNDSNDGLSTGTAWKTIAKVNGQTFAAGDSVLFKRGGVWQESLAPPSSGTSGNPISFDAYGTGDAPTITGALNLGSTSWTLDSGNIDGDELRAVQGQRVGAEAHDVKDGVRGAV